MHRNRKVQEATKYLRSLGVAKQEDVASGVGRSQSWVSHQLCGRRSFTIELDIALRGFLLGAGLRPEEIEERISHLRTLASAPDA